MNKTFSLYGGRVQLDFNSNGHRYKIKLDDRIIKPKGVTTLCKQDSDSLLGWAVGCAAAKAQSFGLTAEQAKEVKDAYIVDRAAKGDYGTAVHKACADFLEFMTEAFDQFVVAAFLHSLEHRAIVTNFLKLLVDKELSVVLSERPIYSIQYNYAGTFDLLLKDKEGKLIMADIKTGKHIFDAWKQLAGYSLAYVEEFPEQKIDRYAVFHLDGENFDYKEHDNAMTLEDVAAFKASVYLHQYAEKINLKSSY